jgi:MSHA biogenesis protein MshP
MMRRQQQPAVGTRGFALIPALFLIVVLGALAAVAVRVSVGQSQAVIMGLQQARALAAARAGIEWGAYRALNGACGGTTLNLAEQSLSGFQVVVTCTATSFAEGAATLSSYTIAATSTIGSYGKPDYVRRVVRATFTDAP